jgi:hypothetical protein
MHISNQNSNSVDVRPHLVMLNATILIWKVITHGTNTLHISDHVNATVQHIIIFFHVCNILQCHNLTIAEPTFNYWPWKFLIHYYNYKLNKKHQMKNTTQKC